MRSLTRRSILGAGILAPFLTFGRASAKRKGQTLMAAPDPHALSHGAGGDDPITTLGPVTIVTPNGTTISIEDGYIGIDQRDANGTLRNHVELTDHHLNAYHGDANGTNRGYIELADDYSDLAKLGSDGVQGARLRLNDDGHVQITGSSLTFNGSPV